MTDQHWHEAGYLADDGVVYIGPARKTLPSDIPPITLHRYLTVEYVDMTDDIRRWLLGIPAGFPSWYVPPRPALPIGPIGQKLRTLRQLLDDPVVRAAMVE